MTGDQEQGLLHRGKAGCPERATIKLNRVLAEGHSLN